MKSEKSPRRPKRLSILVADDDRDIVLTLTTILVDEGHVVHSVYRGDHVIDAARRSKPDVCILDIELPGPSGYALAQELSATSGHRPFLIAISGKYTRKSEQLLAQTVGFDRFFTKPADPDELLQFLDEIASGGSTVR